MIDRKKFYDAIRRSLFKMITPSQFKGMENILDVWEEHYVDNDIRWLADAMGQAYHETAHTMQPIVERGNHAYFKKYEPGTRLGRRLGNTINGDGWRFRGRGHIQLTGRYNYGLASRKLGIDLVSDPDRALEPVISAHIMFRGMIEGWFTGKKLADYIKPGGKADYVRSRRIVNGNDKARLIASYIRKFAVALRSAHVDVKQMPVMASVTNKHDDELERQSADDRNDIPRRKSRLQSTTWWASMFQRVAAAAGGVAAFFSGMEKEVKLALIGGAVVVFLAAMWIARERVKRIIAGLG